MANGQFISQSLVKRRAASALAAAKERNNWSDSEVADRLGVCRTTVQNRLDGDDPSKQMTIHELLRSLQHDPRIANDILALAGHRAEPIELVPDDTCDRAKESRVLSAALALSVALADGEIKNEEIVANRATIEAAIESLQGLLSRIGPQDLRA